MVAHGVSVIRLLRQNRAILVKVLSRTSCDINGLPGSPWRPGGAPPNMDDRRHDRAAFGRPVSYLLTQRFASRSPFLHLVDADRLVRVLGLSGLDIRIVQLLDARGHGGPIIITARRKPRVLLDSLLHRLLAWGLDRKSVV